MYKNNLHYLLFKLICLIFLLFLIIIVIENDVLFNNDTGKLGKRNSKTRSADPASPPKKMLWYSKMNDSCQ